MKDIQYSSAVDEFLYTNEMDSGIKCYVLPKKGFVEKQAMIAVNYGSVDNEFEANGKIEKMPSGIAHYLEHKLFEEREGNVFEKFSKLGGNVNAFTNFTNTAYYFNTTENFDANFGTLLDFVQEPYFTDENVEKERGIISQEINMYQDDPIWIVYINMLAGLYKNKYFKENIAGSVSSIKKITKDMLLDCYNKFYVPQNMAIICCGDVDVENIFRIVEEKIQKKRPKEIHRVQPKEPQKINKKLIKENLAISTPLFYIGFKDNDESTLITEKTAAIKVLLDIVAGESSAFYEKLYNKGFINQHFTIEYITNIYFGNSIFSGFSKHWEEVRELLLYELKEIKKNGISEDHFQRIKNKHIGRFIRGFNSIDALASSQVDYFSKGTDIFAALDSYVNLQKNKVEEFLVKHLTEENMTTSVVLPEKGFFSLGR